MQSTNRGTRIITIAAFAIALALPLVVSAQTPPSATELQDPLGTGEGGIPVLAGRVIRAGFGIVGSIALLVFTYGGFLWLTSGGKSEMIQKGKDTMVWASLGIAVVFAAYAITQFIISALSGGSGGS